MPTEPMTILSDAHRLLPDAMGTDDWSEDTFRVHQHRRKAVSDLYIGINTTLDPRLCVHGWESGYHSVADARFG